MPLAKSVHSVIVLSALAVPTAVAAESAYMSTYSDLDFAKCEIVHEDSEFGLVEWRCAGDHGYDILATEADLRLYLAYQKKGELHGAPVTPSDTETNSDLSSDEAEAGDRSLGQTIPPFNNLGPKLEWRLGKEAGAEPFATIVRYRYQADPDETDEGQVLVVSRFREGESCHVAYIDALANRNANKMAREIADKYAKGGQCPEGSAPVLGLGGEILQ
ncbi:MAG: hypothetical protein RLN89_04990 [Parvibaculum sp.]